MPTLKLPLLDQSILVELDIQTVSNDIWWSSSTSNLQSKETHICWNSVLVRLMPTICRLFKPSHSLIILLVNYLDLIINGIICTFLSPDMFDIKFDSFDHTFAYSFVPWVYGHFFVCSFLHMYGVLLA